MSKPALINQKLKSKTREDIRDIKIQCGKWKNLKNIFKKPQQTNNFQSKKNRNILCVGSQFSINVVIDIVISNFTRKI